MSVTPKDLLWMLVRAYQYFISPLLPPACRFHPNCSAYAEQALLDHGAWRGGWMTAGRLCRCGPWHAGGLDLVPDVKTAVKSTARGTLQGHQ
ncbi:MAG: membrane protein insertion efficiency factor YidD [Betaproteobacteria bacterium]|nr:membrane protein insertion efficiency factor YidD [Betaproteobacteria bacterium]MSQ87820.1 membrane protein insertion efficiency factor YidD [Betaproteobacteria bacterium]